jgi:protein-S-isoprenylcysteine O-methyltransferase Ste14
MTDTPPPPAKFPWPPALIVVALVFGFALSRLLPEWPFPERASQIAGAAVIIASLSVDFWCMRLFRRRSTTLAPHRAASALVVEGPYRFTRNPIYIAHIALTIGVGVCARSPGVVLMAPLLFFALDRLAAAPEEKRLAEQFGAEFEAFSARTPRWI